MKGFEPDDPMALVGIGIPGGDPDLVARCLVEEYVRLGMDDAQLMRLFRHPFYAGAHAIYRLRGEAYVTALLAEARRQWGHPRFTVRESDGRSAFAGATDSGEVSEGAPSDDPREA